MASSYLRPVSHGLGDEVGLWWLDLDVYAASVSLSGLDPAELSRAGRMTDPAGARRFLASRHALRSLVSGELHRPASSIHWSANPFGKLLAVDSDLHFSLSRSGREALIGLVRDRAIGVDLEIERTIEDAAELAQLHFTANELAVLSKTAMRTRNRRFLECWTRKEACIKALGTGLSLPLSGVDAGFHAGSRVARVIFDGHAGEVAVSAAGLPSGAIAAVAVATPEAARVFQAALRRLREPPGGGEIGP